VSVPHSLNMHTVYMMLTDDIDTGLSSAYNKYKLLAFLPIISAMLSIRTFVIIIIVKTLFVRHYLKFPAEVHDS